MTNQEMQKIQREVISELGNNFKLEGIDIFSLPKHELDMIIKGFQIGVNYADKIFKREVIDKMMEL